MSKLFLPLMSLFIASAVLAGSPSVLHAMQTLQPAEIHSDDTAHAVIKHAPFRHAQAVVLTHKKPALHQGSLLTATHLLQQMQDCFQQVKDQALLTPTLANVRHFILLQHWVVEQSKQFHLLVKGFKHVSPADQHTTRITGMSIPNNDENADSFQLKRSEPTQVSHSGGMDEVIDRAKERTQ